MRPTPTCRWRWRPRRAAGLSGGLDGHCYLPGPACLPACVPACPEACPSRLHFPPRSGAPLLALGNPERVCGRPVELGPYAPQGRALQEHTGEPRGRVPWGRPQDGPWLQPAPPLGPVACSRVAFLAPAPPATWGSSSRGGARRHKHPCPVWPRVPECALGAIVFRSRGWAGVEFSSICITKSLLKCTLRAKAKCLGSPESSAAEGPWTLVVAWRASQPGQLRARGLWA